MIHTYIYRQRQLSIDLMPVLLSRTERRGQTDNVTRSVQIILDNYQRNEMKVKAITLKILLLLRVWLPILDLATQNVALFENLLSSASEGKFV